MNSLESRGLLFDMDGVLLDSIAGVVRVWSEWAARHGYDPAATVHTAHGRPAIQTVRLLAPQLDAEAELSWLERREIEEAFDVAAHPGAAELLGSLPPERWAIVTSSTRALALERLRRAQLPVPRRMITASEIVHGKPHPEPYLKGAELLGLEPSECVVVEDAPSGICSGRAAGMAVLAVPTTYAPGELSEATALLPALASLKATIVGDFIRLNW